MEFVIVTYPKDRGVNVDGGPLGKVGKVLRMAAGTHDFDLGAPLDYMPSSHTVQVSRTSLANPMVVAFLPVVVTAAEEEMSLPQPQTSMRRRARKRVRVARKGAAKKVAKKAAKKSVKKSVKKTAKKGVTKTAKTGAKRAAKKVVKKVVKRATKTATKTTAKKSTRRAAKKVATKRGKPGRKRS